MAVVHRQQLSFSFLVEQYVLALRGRGLLLSPSDQALIEEWERSGVPARVVCDAIRRAFEQRQEKRGARARTPSSLDFCQKAVASAISGWINGQVGGRSAPSEPLER